MNVLLIMSDEHRRDALGCMGHPIVKTPNLDKLAAKGCRFTAAYCPSPLCGPSRASFVTGKYVHENGCWDQELHYDGTTGSWGEYLHSHGVRVTTIGKLDFAEGTEGGFPDQRLVQHRKKREKAGASQNAQKQKAASETEEKSFGQKQLEQAGPGDYWTNRVERETAEAVRFLREEAPLELSPWVLWLNYLPPHFPLVAPERFYALYPHEEVDLPYDTGPTERHSVTEELRVHFRMGSPDERTVRRARAAYYGLCSFIDEQVGQVLQELEASGAAENTLIVYTSDHGDHLGDHDLWWKSSMYEQAVGIPLIISGAGIDARTVDVPVSLLDVTATVADAVGLLQQTGWRGRTLLPICRGKCKEAGWARRPVFAEYHAHGTLHSMFMLRKGAHKYVYHPHRPAQLFDLSEDPREMYDLAARPETAGLLRELHADLLAIADPDETDAFVRRAVKMTGLPEKGEP